MSQENQNSPDASLENTEFNFKVQKNFFESDTHQDLIGKSISRVRILPGNLANEDLYLLTYRGSPNLSIYDANGQLIDIDHYLPEDYKKVDAKKVENMIDSFPALDKKLLTNKRDFAGILGKISSLGGGDFFAGLSKQFGIECSHEQAIEYVKNHLGDVPLDEAPGQIKKKYSNLGEFLQSLLGFLQKKGTGHVHITSKGNIVITPLLRRSGLAIIIETHNASGSLLPPRKWNIIRTKSAPELEQALVFRTADVQAFFEENPTSEYHTTVRYKLFKKQNQLAFDSLLDNTDNLLRVDLYSNCFQILAADEDVVMVLNSAKSITVVNAHRSVVPQKWSREIKLPTSARWAKVDQNLSAVFIQDNFGKISVHSIVGDRTQPMADIGIFNLGFEIDQGGNLLVMDDTGQLMRVATNINDLENPTEQKGITDMLKNIAHLFQSDQLFSEKQFARVLTTVEEVAPKTVPPGIVDKVRFDFETNVEHMLSRAGNRFEDLLNVKQQIALARQNLSDELTYQSEQEGIPLVGYKLQRIVNGVLSPIEKRVNDLVELARSTYLLEKTEAFVEGMTALDDPHQYRDILNTVRKYQEEFESMSSEAVTDNYTSFLAYQKKLSQAFADQMVKDDSSLKTFIRGEIEQIELAIQQTHDAKQLEILLGTHPAALELMNMLKQPYVLQSIAKDQSFSPAGIQRRLFKNVEKRQLEIKEAVDRKTAEKRAAKEQLADMCSKAIEFFVESHTGSFSLIELSNTAAYNQLNDDFYRIEEYFGDTRLANELRRKLERRILERTRKDLEKIVAFEGKYAFIRNDADLYVDTEASIQEFPHWTLELIDKKGSPDTYLATFIRSSDYSVYRPSVQDNLAAGKAFEIEGEEFAEYWASFKGYQGEGFGKEYLQALWDIFYQRNTPEDFPQFESASLRKDLPVTEPQKKALRCALEIKLRREAERSRVRKVPRISPEFIDNTPYFKYKLNEFIIKAKLQLMSGTGIVLLTGPPSTGKSTFLKFAAWLMNREYFEHAADKWQTKNSLITAIKFSEFGPYATPASFTKAITTANSLINIEEIKEWPEALRKALNPFFGGSRIFMAPDGTSYDIGQNILLCAAANLGTMYRQDDEPFTADFWSRIEVVEYNYAPDKVDNKYINSLFVKKPKPYWTISEMIKDYFSVGSAPSDANAKAIYFAQQFIEFIVLSKTDESIKRQNIQNYINEYFQSPSAALAGQKFNPEEAAKIVLKRIKALRNFSITDFYDLYDHFINGSKLRSAGLRKLPKSDIEQYNQIKIRILVIRYLEGCLRYLREKFYATAGQSEVEGTNREFIKCVLLLDLLGKV